MLPLDSIPGASVEEILSHQNSKCWNPSVLPKVEICSFLRHVVNLKSRLYSKETARFKRRFKRLSVSHLFISCPPPSQLCPRVFSVNGVACTPYVGRCAETRTHAQTPTYAHTQTHPQIHPSIGTHTLEEFAGGAILYPFYKMPFT